MTRGFWAGVGFAVCLAGLLPSPETAAQPVAKKPNILLIVADDLGYTDIGSFGGEIRTPRLDDLAARGVRLSSFYTSPFCSPTRAMLMSGADNHQVGFGAMIELVPPEVRKNPGYEGYLNDRAVPFPELLRQAGYNTYMAGKWHLGTTEEASPAKRLIEYIDGGKGDGKPFFAYLAFTAPHWPLQARDEDIARYEGVYEAGYDEIRRRRLERLKAAGLVPAGAEHYAGHPAWPRWEELAPERRKIEAKRMAVYAAMVEAMDREIGRVLDHLDRIGERDNTFVFFMSDNGADGNTPADVAATRAWIKARFDNSPANTGRKNSYVDYGPGWAQVGQTPFRLYKAFLYEGGISVPALAVLPKGTPDQAATGDRLSGAFVHTMDVAPTLLELAGAQHPGTTYQGRSVAPLMGRSMLSLLSGQAEAVHGPEHVTGWELQGRKALRKGDWKIVYANPPWGTGQWELFDIARDRAELHDLSAAQPEKLQELVAEYERWAAKTGTLDLTGLAAEVGYSNGRLYYEDMQ